MAKSDPSLLNPVPASRTRVARCGTAAPESLLSVQTPPLTIMVRESVRDHSFAVGHPTDKALRLFFSKIPKMKALRRRRRPVRGDR